MCVIITCDIFLIKLASASASASDIVGYWMKQSKPQALKCAKASDPSLRERVDEYTYRPIFFNIKNAN